MTDLLTDLTAASTGNRDLSDRVLLALGWRRMNRGFEQGWISPNRTVYPLAPDPTVNLQDAVDLLEHDFSYSISAWYGEDAEVAVGNGSLRYEGSAPTAALAFSIALLKRAQT